MFTKSADNYITRFCLQTIRTSAVNFQKNKLKLITATGCSVSKILSLRSPIDINDINAPFQIEDPLVRETKDFIVSLVTHLYEQCLYSPAGMSPKLNLIKTVIWPRRTNQELQAIVVESVEYSSVNESKLSCKLLQFFFRLDTVESLTPDSL